MTKKDLSIAVGERVRYYRLTAKLSQEELALQASINPAYLGQVERGLKCPTVDTLYKIAEAMNVPLPDLVRVEQSLNDATKENDSLHSLMAQIPQSKAEDLYDIMERIIQLLK